MAKLTTEEFIAAIKELTSTSITGSTLPVTWTQFISTSLTGIPVFKLL